MSLRFSRLTRPAIRALEQGQKLNEHGVTAERTATGDIRYSVNVMVDGQRIHRVVGRESEGVTREQAERLIESLRTKAREDRFDLPTGRKLHRSFAEAADEYITKMEASGGKDMKNKKRHLREYLVPFMGTERLDKITEFRLKLYRKARVDKGAAHATVNRELATFSHLMNRAASKDWGWIKADALPNIPKEKETRKKIRILTEEQRQQLIDAAVADQDPHAWLFVMFGLNASMRHSEIVRRRYDEIDFENCRIWIDRAKAGEREQPITASLRDALLRQQSMEADPNGWIFPAKRSTCKTPHRPDMEGPFARIVTRAGLDPRTCTPHVMRHTAISALVMKRVDVPTIQKISGHKTTSMVMHYVHLFGEHIDNAISALDMGISDAVTPKLHTPSVGANSDPQGDNVISLGKSAA